MYGGAARAPRRRGGGGGIVKNFHWEGEPQRELDTATTTTTTSLRTLQLIIRSTASTTSGVPPSSRTAYDYSTRHLHGTARRSNEPYTPRQVYNKPLIPHPTRPAWTY